MNLLSEAHIFKIYDQGADAIVRLVHRLADRIDELEVQPIRAPQPVIASLSKELARVKQTLTRQSQELLALQQLNHQLRRRLRELEHEVERGAPVARFRPALAESPAHQKPPPEVRAEGRRPAPTPRRDAQAVRAPRPRHHPCAA